MFFLFKHCDIKHKNLTTTFLSHYEIPEETRIFISIVSTNQPSCSRSCKEIHAVAVKLTFNLFNLCSKDFNYTCQKSCAQTALNAWFFKGIFLTLSSN